MASRLITAAIASLFIISTAHAGGWVKDWWSNVYELRIEDQQWQDLSESLQKKCPDKLKRYRKLVAENPNSEYYRYKLQSWIKKCYTPQ